MVFTGTEDWNLTETKKEELLKSKKIFQAETIAGQRPWTRKMLGVTETPRRRQGSQGKRHEIKL